MKKFLFAVMFALAAFNSSYAQVTNEKKSMEENMKEVSLSIAKALFGMLSGGAGHVHSDETILTHIGRRSENCHD